MRSRLTHWSEQWSSPARSAWRSVNLLLGDLGESLGAAGEFDPCT
jgi:hypothetical protein